MAAELASQGIRVNAIALGATAIEHVKEEQIEKLLQITPMGRIGVPAEIAAFALFLASDAAGWVAGQIIDAADALGISG